MHAEILERYKKLNLAPYKGFVNPTYEAITDANGTITDVKVTYDEGYAEQMLRYSKDLLPASYSKQLISMDIKEQLKDIKTQLRLSMNGVVSHSMREKGLNYKLNFGVELPRIKVDCRHVREES